MGKKIKHPKRSGLIIGLISGPIVIALVLGVVILFHYLNKVNYVPLKENYTILDETESFIEDVINPLCETRSDTSKEEIDEFQREAKEQLAKLGSMDYKKVGNVYNVLLIGSDTRVSGEDGRSDTMLLISINRSKNKIIATSFLRDIYANIPGKGFEKLNAAYAYGGVELLLDTLKDNFSIEIDRYISVDFYSFVGVIDIIGGIDVPVEEDELYWCNQYIHASNLLLGEPEHDGYLTYADGSVQHLSGKQALAYARFRYVGNGDFTRTERQRKIVNIIFDKIASAKVGTVFKFLDSLLENVTTNIPKGEFIQLIGDLLKIKKYDIISWNIPDEDFKYMTINGMDSIVIDFNLYVDKLYSNIYE